jgi:PAS domain S-box-containing protein
VQPSEQLFRSIFDNAQIGISFFNIHGGVVFTNRAFQEMLGYTEKELADLANWDAIIHPEERAAGAERYAELVQGKHEKDEWEQRFVQHDGRILVANARFTLIRDADGKPQYVASLTEDITERKRAQEERNRVTKQMEMLLESTGQSIYGIDPQGNCSFINRATCEMVGYRPEEALGRNMHDLVHHHKPDGSLYPVEECPVYRALRKGEGCRVDTEVVWRRDGSSIQVEYSSFPILEGGAITGAVVTVVDITERKRSEEKVRESEQLFRSIFENAQIGISSYRIATQEHFSNRALQEMLGYTGEELCRLEQWDEIVHPEERTSGAERYNELIQGKRETDEYEHRFIHRDGRIIIANGRFNLLRDATGKPQHVVAMTEDITSRKRDQEAVRESEQLFRSIFENSQIGIGLYKIDSQEHVSNRALHDMLGYTGEELSRLGQWDEIVPAEERASCGQRYAELVQGKRETDEYEQHFIRRDGTIVLGNGKFQLLRDANGKPQCIVGLTEDITERRRAQEALQAREQLFRSIFENAQIGISIFNINAQEHITNLALQEMLGYSEKELMSLEQWDSIVHPDARALGAQRYADLIQGRRDKDEFENRYVRRDGRIVVSNGRFNLLRDLAGKPQYLVALTEDITVRKRAEEKLRESEQLFRTIFENAPVGISLYNVAKQQYITNRALHEMLACTHEDLSSVEKWNQIVHPDERASGAERYAELLRGERAYDEWEQRFVLRDGRIVIADGRFSVIRDVAGKPQFLLNMTEDITERKAAEELLRRREEELRRANFLADTALELSKAGYWHVPLDGSGWYNSSARRVAVFGDLPRPDYRYRLDEMFGHASEADEAAAKIAREAFSAAVEGKTPKYDTVFAYKRPIDGKVAWVRALGHVVKDSDGKPTDMYGVSQDITEFKRLEAELLTAKEAAEAATKAKSGFLANMSHEIRTPMNAILGMTHLALKTELTPKQRDYLTKTRVAAQGLLGIINDILDFSKIEAGKLNLERTDFRLDVVLDNLSTMVSQRAHEKNLEFLVAAQPDLPAILVGDPLRLSQVLINLVNNAVKFTERGEIVVTVKLEERVSNQVKLKFGVRDSGIGMTPEQTARLFQAFSQADSSTTRKYGGTGLGLFICKRLVETMEGNIWADSEYGRGSTFCFTAWFGVGTVEKRQRALPPGLTGVRVLVVDDNATGREILADMLRQFTFRVESASSGNDALRELANADTQDPYRLVLMDWQMPGLDGLETSRRVKCGGNLRNLPKILMITEFDREEIHKQAQEIEIEGILQKPVSPSVLFDTLMSLFGVATEEGVPDTARKGDRDLPLASGIRVLLVEDNEVNQQVARELLESEGANVTIANHGAEAVKILTQGNQPPPFDIVLMDLQMPEMDGLTATRLLRTEPRLQQLPIIAMTAHVMAEEVQRCLDAGMNDHVGKPIDPGPFFTTLARWTRGHKREVADVPARARGTEEEIILPEIEGIHIAGGLQRIAGNKRMYRDLLAQFAVKQKSAGERIATAIESGDHHQAERLAHSLKGVAGNLGIDQIFRLAGNLERAIRESQDGVEGLVEELASALDRQIQTIQESLKVATPIAGKRETAGLVDPIAVSTAVARLRELLEASDADAPDAYANLAEILQGTVDPSRLDALSAAVNAFDFKTALIKLNDIAGQFGATQN